MSLEAWGDEGEVGIEGYVTDESYDEMCAEKDDEIKRLKAVNERDRSQVAEVFNEIMEAIRRREWLRLGRGSYEYDDDRWRGEFSQAIDEVVAAAEPLRKIAADWSDCPTDPKEIAAARAGPSPSDTIPEGRKDG